MIPVNRYANRPFETTNQWANAKWNVFQVENEWATQMIKKMQ